jgi:hypothetical protein
MEQEQERSPSLFVVVEISFTSPSPERACQRSSNGYLSA